MKEEEKRDPLPRLHLDILRFVTKCQSQNGLRHGDHVRYRRYASKKIRRLRKNVGLSHGKGKLYLKSDVSELEDEKIKEDVQYLMIPLMTAERSWAYAMALKDEENEENLRIRVSKLKRLRKAVKWSRQLRELCEKVGDDRTSLEAEAYSAFMAAQYCLENDDFESAAKHFSTSSKIYGQLSSALMSQDAEQEQLFSERQRKSSKSLEYCKHMAKRLGVADLSALQGDMGGTIDSELQAKLDSVLTEARKKEAASLLHLEWYGHRIPVRSEATRLAVLRASDKAKQIESSKLSSLYLEAFSLCDDAMRSVRKDKSKIKENSVLKVDRAIEEFSKLSKYIKEMKLNLQVKHKLMLVDDMILRFDGQKRRQSLFDASSTLESKQEQQQQQQQKGLKRRVKASDLVRMYDTLIDHVRELRDIAKEASNDAEGETETTAETILRLNRCFYIAKSFEAHEKWAEAFALYEHVMSLLDKANEKNKNSSSKVLSAIQSGSTIERVSKLVRGAKIRCHAKAYASRMEPKKQKKSKKQFLIDRLDTYGTSEQHMEWSKDEKAPFRVASVPAKYEPVPCKPCLFDVAFTKLSRPSLLHRLDKAKQEEVKARRVSLEEELEDDDFDSADEVETPDVPGDEGKNEEKDNGGGGWLGGWFG